MMCLCLISRRMSLVLDVLENLDEKMTLEQFADYVKTAFDVPAVRFVGDPTTEIHKVAVLGGDGNKYIRCRKTERGRRVCDRRPLLSCCP